MKPGSTAGTSLRLAQGWSGVIDGWYSVLTMVHANTMSGSVQTGARPRTHRRDSSAAPRVPSSTAGTPMYQNTQCRLSS